MAKPSRTLTAFGKDLDALLKRSGNLSIREYADQANVSYKYVLQLRTMSARQPGRLYPNLLKPFVQLKVIDLVDSHRLSLRHRNRPLSIAECQELFPDIPEQELTESIRQALESDDSHDTILKTVASPPITYSPLNHRVFIGREAELDILQSAFDNAVSGKGSLVMVVGEPGIGKTALCERLSTYVSSRGGKTLVGHCYSEKSLSLPYLAFMEVLRSDIQMENISELREELGNTAMVLGRIVPEIAEKLKIYPRREADSEEDRYRLMEAVTNFLSRIATVQPLLVILEDLHNADKDTLEMLTHISRYLEEKLLLLVGTYRDVEVDRTHPLSATLAELRRLPNFGRILVKGLNADEVRQMISSITSQDVPRRLSELIHHQTEGNPLFIQEVTRYLVEEGLFSLQGETQQSAKDVSVEMRLPDGLRDVIGKRLSGLSEPCNKVLAVAAVIGRDFSLEVLQKVAGMTDEEIFKALEEARKAAVIEERTDVGATVDYHFTHAFFRQILYEEIIAPRRNRLHQQVAQALEEVYKTRLDEHAAELAEHFSYSSDAADLRKAVSYGEMAAQRAMDIYAYREAVRLLEQALKVQGVLDPDDRSKRCDILLALSEAHILAGEARRALDAELPEAFSLAEAIQDSSRATQASSRAIRALYAYGAATAYAAPEASEWAERFNRYASPETSDRVLADTALGSVRCQTGHPEEGIPLLQRALELSRHLSDHQAFRRAAIGWLGNAMTPRHTDEWMPVVEELIHTPRFGLSPEALAMDLFIQGNVFLHLGERERAEEVWGEITDIAERTRQPAVQLMAMATEARICAMDGRLEEAIQITHRLTVTGREFGMPERAGTMVATTGLRPRLQLGGGSNALRRNAEFAEMVSDKPLKTFCLAHLGHAAEVMEELWLMTTMRSNIDPDQDETSASQDVLMLEAAVLVNHQEAADFLLKRLSGSRIHTTGIWHNTCMDRHLGAAAALLGRPDDALKHYQEAIKVCTDMRFRPELALTRLQLAELLLEHYPDEESEALEHLDFAINEFREMKMQPSLERALRHKEILGA
ncbi:MAG TPA: AAA family ATPase [Dehalococcoidia bacterium]|nr:AAA family ATPase [Dehalococcoidia bacterium]